MEWSLELSLESTILEAKFLFHQKPGEGERRECKKSTENPRSRVKISQEKLRKSAQMLNRAAPTIAAARHDLRPLQAIVTSAPYRRRRVSLNF